MSADLSVSSHYGITHVRVNNFSKGTRPRDILFFKDTLSIEEEKLFKACRSVRLFPRVITSEVPPP